MEPVEKAGYVVGVVDDIQDAHAAAALAAEGDVESEDPGEKLGPAAGRSEEVVEEAGGVEIAPLQVVEDDDQRSALGNVRIPYSGRPDRPGGRQLPWTD